MNKVLLYRTAANTWAAAVGYDPKSVVRTGAYDTVSPVAKAIAHDLKWPLVMVPGYKAPENYAGPVSWRD